MLNWTPNRRSHLDVESDIISSLMTNMDPCRLVKICIDHQNSFAYRIFLTLLSLLLKGPPHPSSERCILVYKSHFFPFQLPFPTKYKYKARYLIFGNE